MSEPDPVPDGAPRDVPERGDLAEGAERLARRLPRRVLRGLAAVRHRWRRSLRLRVVVATSVLGGIVVLVVGNLLLARIAAAVQESSVAAAVGETKGLYAQVQELTKNRTGDVTAFADTLAVRFSNGTTRYVVVRRELGTTGDQEQLKRDVFSPTLGADVVDQVVPLELRRQVVDDPAQLHKQVVGLPAVGGGPTVDPAVTVGALLRGVVPDENWELYFVYRTDRDATVLDLVRRTFVLGGGALVLLVAGVAFVVTRQVVAPVRQAARTAEEIASGRLDRRMRVRGEDELARLGGAFNEMASSLERQIHRLEELSRVQRRFVSDVSHELRTPLTTIRMATEVLHEARTGFDPATARSAELLLAQLDRFESLLADLLEVSRFDAGAAQLEADPVDLRDVVGRVVDGLRPLADSRGSAFVADLGPLPCIAEIDARRVERIVRNLVGNAIEHGEGRPIDVRVAGSDDAVAVVVRDHGVGLTPGEARMVFNRFWRADPARARSTGGTGLGLAIALEDAHLHGGWLQVWGDPGHGACFRLTLPRRAGVVLTTSPLPLVPADAHVAGASDGAAGTHLAGTGLASGPRGGLDVDALIADLDTQVPAPVDGER